jgi:acyl carrier protein
MVSEKEIRHKITHWVSTMQGIKLPDNQDAHLLFDTRLSVVQLDWLLNAVETEYHVALPVVMEDNINSVNNLARFVAEHSEA